MGVQTPHPPAPSLRLDDRVLGGLLLLGNVPEELRARILPELFEHPLRPVVRALLEAAETSGRCDPAAVAEILARDGLGTERILRLRELAAVGDPLEELGPHLRLLEERQTAQARPDKSLRLPESCYPQDGWLAGYLDYAPRGIHAPRTYHLACGLFCVGAAAGPNILVTAGAEPIHLNLFVCLLGPSGIGQKSRTIDRARRILRAVKENLILPDEFSRESLYRALDQDAHRVLTWREFGKYLQVSRREYMAGTTEFLTELYDCPPDQARTLQGVSYAIKNPHVSILTASTPEWLFRHMPEVDIGAGWFPRFAYATYEPKPPRRRDLGPWDQAQVNRLVADLHTRVTRPRTLQLGETQQLFDRYEDYLEARAALGGTNPLLTAFQARLPLLLLKVTACYHVAESDQERISPHTFRRAQLLVDHLFAGFAHLLATKWASDPQDARTQKVREIIRRSPGITHSRLQRNSHLSARDLEQALRTLSDGGELTEPFTGKTGKERRYTLGPTEEEGEKEAK